MNQTSYLENIQETFFGSTRVPSPRLAGIVLLVSALVIAPLAIASVTREDAAGDVTVRTSVARADPVAKLLCSAPALDLLWTRVEASNGNIDVHFSVADITAEPACLGETTDWSFQSWSGSLTHDGLNSIGFSAVEYGFRPEIEVCTTIVQWPVQGEQVCKAADPSEPLHWSVPISGTYKEWNSSTIHAYDFSGVTFLEDTVRSLSWSTFNHVEVDFSDEASIGPLSVDAPQP